MAAKPYTHCTHSRYLGYAVPTSLDDKQFFQAHGLFRVEGRDVYCDLPIAPWEAALGGKVKMPTPGGAVDLKTPKGARSGQKLRLKGRGIPGKPAGHLYAVLQIVVPPAETDEHRALYEQMARDMKFDPRARMGV